MTGRPQPLEPRFWKKVHKTETCWLWTGCINDNGYGLFSLTRNGRRAHRVAWMLAYGEIPTGLDVCHRCDVRHCVRPDHLFLGTRRDNMQDAVAKGRHGNQRKTHCIHGHHLTDVTTWRYSTTGRVCKACAMERQRRYRARKKTH